MDIRINGGFWHDRKELNRNVTIGSIYDRFAETGRFSALKCGWKPGMENKPHIFFDSDVAKWIEAAAYIIGDTESTQPSEESTLRVLSSKVDEMVSDILKNQREDGYFNSYFLTCEPEGIFRKRYNHELYCAGHLIEAAIAYDKATGKDAFLKAMMKYADCIYRVFVIEKSAAFTTPGHEEIELALIKLYDHTGIRKYLELAGFFLYERAKRSEGNAHPVDITDPFVRQNHVDFVSQSDTPVTEISHAVGHCVRALYLYTGMAMYAERTDDTEMKNACLRIYRDIIEKKISITGGIGGDPSTEGFAAPYVLSNRFNYNETCASIALMMFSDEMAAFADDPSYDDLIEQILYNGMLSGISLSGDSFFYENALEIDRRDYEKSRGFAAADVHRRGILAERRLQRAKVFTCSCCPPNIARTIASVEKYFYRTDGNTVFVRQFADSEAHFEIGGKPAILRQETGYPSEGTVKFFYSGEPAVIKIRIPGWCSGAFSTNTEVKNGWLTVSVRNGDTFTIDFPMKIRLIEARPEVGDDCGRIAVMRGPFVYCMESVDNGPDLRDISLNGTDGFEVIRDPDLSADCLLFDGFRRKWDGSALYRARQDDRIPVKVKMIPYHTFANRGESDMLIWTMSE